MNSFGDDIAALFKVLQEPADDALWIRQSTVGSWELCPGRVMQSNQAGFNNLPSEAMSFGTLVHDLIECSLSTGLMSFTAIDVFDIWHSLVRDEYGVELEELASEDFIIGSSLEAVGAHQLWVDKVLPTLPTGEKLIEKKLTAPLGVLDSGREVWLHGTGDLLYLDGHVGYDWKTAGRGWNETKAHFIGQPNAYAYLHEYNHDIFIEDWKYWVFNRQSQTWELHVTKRTRRQAESWLRHAFGIAKSIDAGATAYTQVESPYGKFKRGWWCSAKYCGAWDICPAKYLNDGVDESEKGVVTWT